MVCARCASHPPHFDHARACALYEGAVRHIVHALKYRGHQSLGRPLGALMRETGRVWLAEADAVVPVPLHPWRRLRRGFNQADVLACALGRPVWRPLVRRRLGTPQARLSGDHRRRNVHGAYALALSAGWIARGRPRTVVLVDDVMTTGATLDACSELLRDAGVEWIGALTVARAAHAIAAAGEATPPHRPLPAPRPWILPR
jgi:ComF family protein